MKFLIDELVAPPVPQDVVTEFELQTRLRLPDAYRDFLTTYNGGHPVPDFVDMPPDENWPAQFQYFYGLDADEWFLDAWTRFRFLDTRIPFGLLMFGTLSLECAELCFDFRRFPGNSLHARFRRFMFGSELLDSSKEDIPVKFFDSRSFNETGRFREKDLFGVASNFEEFVGKFRTLSPAEESKIKQLMPAPDPSDIARAKERPAHAAVPPKDWTAEANRPPRLAALARKRQQS